uniref:Uncharacterized protein n=1 Tax=Oryzias latipes TaxID=8090 RepID=A0A3P9JWD9_ORYLA
METGSFIPNYPGLRVEGGAKTLRVSEVFGGNTPDVFQMADESDSRSDEMGDDSVFYSDEEQEQKDRLAFLSSHFGVKRCRQLVNSVAEGEPVQQIEEDPGEVFINHGSLEKQAMWTKEEFHSLHMLSSHKINALQPEEAPAEFTKTLPTSWKDVQQQQYTDVDIRTEHDKDTPEEKGKRRRNRQLQQDSEMEQIPQTHPQFLQNPNPSPSTLPPLKKSGGFNHLTSSKYSTVSYRRICKGNTQRKSSINIFTSDSKS